MTEIHAQVAERQRDIRPAVARPGGGRGPAIFIMVLIAMSGGFFYALEINRANLADKALDTQEASSGGIISSPPDLGIPSASYSAQPYLDARPLVTSGYLEYQGRIRMAQAHRGKSERLLEGQTSLQAAAGQLPAISVLIPGSQASLATQGGVVFQAPAQMSSGSSATAAEKPPEGRVKATKLGNPSSTVPQGSVIHAVMETALDSTRPGFARAIVSRDVVSFDGARVLIPKGSKLFGEYKADLNLGEKRALIQWHRLTRPDGAIIDVDSPAADPLGRAGLKGKVNTHFFERFGGVILQSVLDLGVRAATREATGDTIVLGGVPPTVQGAIVQQPGEVRPTLKAKQGTSITVFVSRDLDFSSVE